MKESGSQEKMIIVSRDMKAKRASMISKMQH